jgi:hypothetical protein
MRLVYLGRGLLTRSVEAGNFANLDAGRCGRGIR